MPGIISWGSSGATIGGITAPAKGSRRATRGTTGGGGATSGVATAATGPGGGSNSMRAARGTEADDGVKTAGAGITGACAG